MKENRITIDFMHNDESYSACYKADFYADKYIDHRLQKVLKCNDTIVGSMIKDRNLMKTFSIAGDGIEEHPPQYGFPHITGAMEYIAELDLLLPHWLIKPRRKDENLD